MKPEFQAKFLQHLSKKKKQEEGFTLIELLVVIIIIGILAAIALPSLLGQVAKAKQAEAKNNTGAVSRAQQAYYLEWQCFTTSLTDLGVGIRTQTENYRYSLVSASGANTCPSTIASQAVAVKPALRSYLGVVSTQIGNTETSEALTVAVACETLKPSQTVPTVAEGTSTCTALGMKDLAATKAGGG